MKHFLKSRSRSIGHALRGIKALLNSEINARIHICATLVVLGLSFFYQISVTEWIMVVFSIVLVIAAEALNTAIEKVVDLCSPNWHGLARDAKDIAAAGVLIASLGAFVVGCLIFIPKIS